MTRDLVFEIGVEELPSGPLYGAIEQLQVSVPKALDAARLEYDDRPRHRLAAAARGPRHRPRRARRTTRSTPQRARRSKAAFAEDGTPTKAAEGFARGKGVAGRVAHRGRGRATAPTCTRRRAEGRRRDRRAAGAARAARRGHRVAEVAALGERRRALLAPRALAARALRRRRSCRSSSPGLSAGASRYGHRFLAPGRSRFPPPRSTRSRWSAATSSPTTTERARLLREGIATVAEQLGGVGGRAREDVRRGREPGRVADGRRSARFDEEFLAVPREILETAMEQPPALLPGRARRRRRWTTGSSSCTTATPSAPRRSSRVTSA